MFADLYRFTQDVLTIGFVACVLALFFIWLEGVYLFVCDVVKERTHRHETLLVTEWGEWDIVYSSRTLPGRWVASLLEE